jgi:hypothetical protein
MREKYFSSCHCSWILSGIICLLIKLWLVAPHDVMATLTPHDDFRFIKHAASLLSGKWFGPYDQTTLITGAFYPIFIAGSYWLGIPLLLAQQLLYAGACVIVVLAFRQYFSRPILFIIFLILLFQPMSYDYPLVGRVLRESLYPTLAFMTMGLAMGLALRTSCSWRKAWPWALCLGLALTAFWNTRDESIWIVPSLLLLLIWSVGNAILNRSSWKKILSLHTLVCTLWLGGILLICAINYSQYGVFTSNEITSAEFKSAYGGLLRIKTPDDEQYYPVVRAARLKAYEVSPATRELKSYLEGEGGTRWQVGWKDIPAAMFLYAFRDAVAAAEHYRNGDETLAYYRRIGQEIDQACAAGLLDCRPRIFSLMPPWRPEYNAMVLPRYWDVCKQIVRLNGFNAKKGQWLSEGDYNLFLTYESVTREKVLPFDPKTLNKTPKFYKHLEDEKTQVLDDIGHGYQKAAPWLFLVGFLLTFGFTLMDLRHKRLSALTLFNWSLLAGIGSVAALLTLLCITSYDSIGRPMHTAFPLVVLFIVVSALDLCHRFWPETQEKLFMSSAMHTVLPDDDTPAVPCAVSIKSD